MFLKSRKVYIIYNLSMALLAILVAIIIVIQFTVPLNSKINLLLNIIDRVIWIIFVIDYLYRLYKSKNKKRFIKRNIFDLISILPFYSFLKVFRGLKIFKIGRLAQLYRASEAVRILAVVERSNKNLSRFMRTNNFNYTLGVAIVIILISSILISFIEKINLGSSLWWSIVTVTTVGYGDIYPQTPYGKIIASILMLVGIGFISSLTSTLSAYFIEKEKYENDILKKSFKFSSNPYKRQVIEDIVVKLENFDNISKEEIYTICKVLESLKK